MDLLKIADKEFSSRLFVGTGKFASNALMHYFLCNGCSPLSCNSGITDTFFQGPHWMIGLLAHQILQISPHSIALSVNRVWLILRNYIFLS